MHRIAVVVALAAVLIPMQDPKPKLEHKPKATPKPTASDKQDSKPAAGRYYTMTELVQKHRKTGKAYSRFLRVPSMHAGIYTLKKGQRDRQSPHAEDEVYYVFKGRAKFRCGKQVEAVEPGSLLYVPARVPHRFEDITEDLELLVLFSTGPVQRPGKKAGAKKPGAKKPGAEKPGKAGTKKAGAKKAGSSRQEQGLPD